MNQPNPCHDHPHWEGGDDLTNGFRLFGTRLALAAPVFLSFIHASEVANV